MSFIEILDENIVDLNIKLSTKKDVLEHLTNLLMEAGYISDKEEFLSDIYLRESEGITGIGGGIAIPHGKSNSVNKTGIAVGKCQSNVEWTSLDGKPVKIIFLFSVSKDKYNKDHLKLLGELAGSLGKKSTTQKLSEMTTFKDLIDAFSEDEKTIIEDIEELNVDIEIKTL